MKLESVLKYGIAIPIFFLACVFFVLYLSISNIGKDAQVTKNESAPFSKLALELKINVIQVQQWLTDISATRAKDGLNDGFDEAENSYNNILEGLDKFKTLYTQKNDTKGLSNIKLLKDNVNEYYRVGKLMAQAYIDGGPEEGNKLMASFDTAASSLNEKLSVFVDQHTSNMEESILSITKSVTYSDYIMLGSFILSSLIIIVIVRSITSPVKRAVAFAKKLAIGEIPERIEVTGKDQISQMFIAYNAVCDSFEEKVNFASAIAEGDLTQQVKLASEHDELGKALQKMITSISTLVSKVRDSSQQIQAASSQLAAASQSLSDGASTSAASLEEVTESMADIQTKTTENANNAEEARKLSLAATNSSMTGSKHMRDMTTSISEIESSSNEVANIIKTIDNIAFQTNLLALNAAVEAARAGQHGKGFAVVAEEVRSLAARSAKSASETESLIAGSNLKVEQGAKIASTTEESLKEIVEMITKSSEIITDIAQASTEQAQNITQTSQGLTKIDSIIQQNTANAEESAAASRQLASQATELSELLEYFKIARTVNTVEQKRPNSLPKKANTKLLTNSN